MLHHCRLGNYQSIADSHVPSCKKLKASLISKKLKIRVFEIKLK